MRECLARITTDNGTDAEINVQLNGFPKSDAEELHKKTHEAIQQAKTQHPDGQLLIIVTDMSNGSIYDIAVNEAASPEELYDKFHEAVKSLTGQ